MFKGLRNILFGYDVFISYARKDGSGYAGALASALGKLDLSCLLDKWETTPSKESPPDLLDGIRRSSIFVLVATDAACCSSEVDKEIEIFRRHAPKAPIIPIAFGAPPKTGLVLDRVPGLPFEIEDLNQQAPSSAVIDRVHSSLTVKTKKKLRQQLAIAASIVIATLLIIAGIVFERWNASRADAERARLASLAEASASASGRGDDRLALGLALNAVSTESKLSSAPEGSLGVRAIYRALFNRKIALTRRLPTSAGTDAMPSPNGRYVSWKREEVKEGHTPAVVLMPTTAIDSKWEIPGTFDGMPVFWVQDQLMTLKTPDGKSQVFELKETGPALVETLSGEVIGVTPARSLILQTENSVDVRIWEHLQDSPSNIFPLNTKFRPGVVVAREGQALSVLQGHDLTLWDAASNKVYKTRIGVAGPMAFSDDGSVIAVRDEKLGIVEVWDRIEGRLNLVRKIPAKVAPWPIDKEPCLLSKSDLVFINEEKDIVRGWALRGNATAPVAVLPNDSRAEVVASPSGDLLASQATDYRQTHLWEIQSDAAHKLIPRATLDGSFVSFSPDSSYIVTSQDSTNSDTRKNYLVWRISSQKTEKIVEIADLFWKPTFGSSGEIIAVIGEELRVYHEGIGREARYARDRQRLGITHAWASYSDDGRYLATKVLNKNVCKGDACVAIYDTQNEKLAAPVRLYSPEVFSPEPPLFSQASRFVAATNFRPLKTLVWDWRRSAEPIYGVEGQSPVFSQDESLLATSNSDKTTVWRITGSSPTSVAIVDGGEPSFGGSGSELMLATYVGSDTALFAWNGTTFNRVGAYSGGRPQLSLDGRLLATVEKNVAIRVWQTSGRREKPDSTLWLNGRRVLVIAFSHDRRRLAAGFADGTAAVWSLASQTELAQFQNPVGTVNLVSFSPDDRKVQTTSWFWLSEFGVAFEDPRCERLEWELLPAVKDLVAFASSLPIGRLTTDECKQYEISNCRWVAPVSGEKK